MAKPYRLITSDDPCKTLADCEVRHFARIIDAANASARAPEPYKQIVYDGGCVARELNPSKAIEREPSRRRREVTKGVYKRKKWELTRRHVLNRDPICRVCGNALSTEVDHIVPLAQGGDPYDPGRLQRICSRCHWDKTAGDNATGGNQAA